MLGEDLPVFLTVKEAALLLRLKRSTAYELVRRGEIPAIRLGRFIRVPREALLSMGKDFDAAVGNSKNAPPPDLR